MNHRAILAILIGATALSVFPAQPRASAQETLTFWYYQPGTSGATRQPRTFGTGGHFMMLFGPATPAGVTLTPGTTVSLSMNQVSATWSPSTTSQTQYALAYVNITITGGVEGDITVFPDTHGNLPSTVNVTLPNTPNPQIFVNAYYFPAGGDGCPPGSICPPGTNAYIDEFGETQGTTLDDTFVKVFIPPAFLSNPGLTNSGNVDGTVDTTNNTVRINALQTAIPFNTNPMKPTGGSFDRWVSGPGGTIGSNPNDLKVGRGKSVYALALYRSSCPNNYYWNQSPTISQCMQIPTCLPGQYWNPTAKTCMPRIGECPSVCHNRCSPQVIGSNGAIIMGCPLPLSCDIGCPGGICTATEIVGDKCQCISCVPIAFAIRPGVGPEPEGPQPVNQPINVVPQQNEIPQPRN